MPITKRNPKSSKFVCRCGARVSMLYALKGQWICAGCAAALKPRRKRQHGKHKRRR